MRQNLCYPDRVTFLSSKIGQISILMLFLSVQACASSSSEGVIARINGKPITLKQIELVMDSRYAPKTIFQHTSLASLKDYYSDALASTIITFLIHDELEKRKIIIDKDQLQNELQLLLKKDPVKYFDEYKKSLPLDPDEWLEMLKNHLETLIFINKIILPEIKISPDKIKEFYHENIKQFTLPNRFELLVVSAKKKEDIEKYCHNPENSWPTEDGKFNFHTYFIEEGENFGDFNLNGNIKIGACSSLKSDNGYWYAIVPKTKYPSRIMELPEAFSVIEEILKMKEVNIRYEDWLEKKLKQTKIEIIPSLKNKIIS